MQARPTRPEKPLFEKTWKLPDSYPVGQLVAVEEVLVHLLDGGPSLVRAPRVIDVIRILGPERRQGLVDLDSKNIQAGHLYDWTLGLNWYLNPNMKCQFNYVLEHRDMPGVAAGWINGFGARVAYDF